MKKLFVILAMLVAMDASGQWQPDVRLTNASGESYTSYNNAWCVAANGNVVHTVWYDFRDGFEPEIYYKRSTDDGVTWGTDTRLTNNPASSYIPSIAVSGSNLHIVWEDRRDQNVEIYYKHSTDGGITWGADTRLTNNSSSRRYPSIAVFGSNLHVIWTDFRNINTEIYYKRSTDNGITWGEDTRLTYNTFNSELPSITVSGSNVHVVWYDNRDGNSEIYYKRSTDNGVTWGTDTRLTNNTYDSYNASIAVFGSIVHVVWADRRDNNYEIYYKRSTNGGVTWGTDTRLTNNTYYSFNPSIAVSGSILHVVWNDERDGNEENYYKRSTDDGINWDADLRLTNSTGRSESPSVAVSGSNVHVIWFDYRDGNTAEIYYKRNPTGNVGIQNISTETPSAYSLSQNYPNPFNPTTKIKFDVVRVGDVKIIVYDVMGREVQTLVNESLKPGTYEVSFDGSALNSGVYFYKLITNVYTETKKMLILK